MQHHHIDDLLAEYLKNEIGGGCPIRAKRALQEVCSLYGRGFHLKPMICAAVEVATVGQLDASMIDRKVRRWCLNVLALIGSTERSKDVIDRVIRTHHNDPDTLASALTAFFKVHPNAYHDLHSRSYINGEQIVLSAHIGGFEIHLKNNSTSINIERESPPILRSALVAVGLGKAPEHLFDPRYENADLVRALSQHDDHEVSQYAVWAINEHPSLNVKHLGFNIADIGGFPPNMRGWTYRLYGESGIKDDLQHEVIYSGSKDASPEARLNLARGLRGTWYDGLEEVTCQWVFEEKTEDIREEILNHMVRQSEHNDDYARIAINAFQDYPKGSAQPRRMLASSRGTSLYRRLRKLEYEAEGDLFGSPILSSVKGGASVTNNNTFNINSLQGGVVSVGGNAQQNGGNINHLSIDQINDICAELQNLARELDSLDVQNDKTEDFSALIKEVLKNPESSRLIRFRNSLRSFFSGASDLAKFGNDVTKITEVAQNLINLLTPL